VSDTSALIPALGVLLIVIAFIVNISGNNFIEKSSLTMAVVKIGGIAIFAIAGLWVADFSFDKTIPTDTVDYTWTSYLGAIALSILAYKGFTTITNSGDEIIKPHQNVGKAIVISLLICTVIYLLVAFAVSLNLSIPEIIKAKDYSLAEAARPAFGEYGLWFTVGIAIVATISGIIASIFAVSRMTTMLTNMKLIPHSHFGMPGKIQKHMLVYTVVIAITLTIFFDLSRIASLGAILYLVMDIMIHWGVLRHLRKDIQANAMIIITAIILDLLVLGAFVWVKGTQDLLVVIVAAVLMTLIFLGEKIFLNRASQ
jgi:amino acid transporter